MKKRVLVVDDANFMRMVVKDSLEPRGFQIVGEATNGAEAVTKYGELKPDLVTMDITTKTKDGLLLDSIALGVRDFVVKPFTSERIQSAAAKALA